MPEQEFLDGERTAEWEHTAEGGDERRSDRRAESHAPHAEEIKRVVDVAEALGISPAVAAAALRDEDGDVPTEVRLGRSIEKVEERLSQYA